ncbi:hypothetical protein F2Q69_00031729 [Brassica cretica]|uniref:Uncharacterized protein n=1 Tax=Brassica cretica TaxID=69181 RepID=A0A8S9RYV2_BRACR|nr:hypothetical protein F2Q69_00031729 [Brassica cretica]
MTVSPLTLALHQGSPGFVTISASPAFDLSDSILDWSELRAVWLNGFSFVYVSPTAELRRAVSLALEEEICLSS